jgi:hypothetical protein
MHKSQYKNLKKYKKKKKTVQHDNPRGQQLHSKTATKDSEEESPKESKT